MKVILRERVRNLGDIGEIANVKDGYARNYLIPKGFAVRASAAAETLVLQEKAKKMEARAKKIEDLELAAKAFEGVSLEFNEHTDPKGKLYGSVSAKSIGAALRALEFEITDAMVLLPTPIKEVGSYTVKISLIEEIEPAISVTVKSDTVEESAEEVMKEEAAAEVTEEVVAEETTEEAAE